MAVSTKTETKAQQHRNNTDKDKNKVMLFQVRHASQEAANLGGGSSTTVRLQVMVLLLEKS